MRFKDRPQLPGAGRTRAGYHHGSHTPTSPEAMPILLGKMAHHTKQIRRVCNNNQTVKYAASSKLFGTIECRAVIRWVSWFQKRGKKDK